MPKVLVLIKETEFPIITHMFLLLRQLFLDDTKVKNFVTCFKGKEATQIHIMQHLCHLCLTSVFFPLSWGCESNFITRKLNH